MWRTSWQRYTKFKKYKFDKRDHLYLDPLDRATVLFRFFGSWRVPIILVTRVSIRMSFLC